MKPGSCGRVKLITTRILVVDDSDQWRILVRSILEGTSSFQVIGEASDGIEAIEKAAMLRPDVVLLDLAMPRLNGIDAAGKIKQVCPESKIIFVAQEDDREIRSTALETGAVAYVVKSTAASELLTAIEWAKPQPPQPERPSREPSTLVRAL